MKDLALDACCLINLLAAECVFPKLEEIVESLEDSTTASALSSLGFALHVPDIVTSECLYMLQPDPDDSRQMVKVPIDLEPFHKGRILHRCDVEGEEESALLLSYATQLDDGEAACLAVAHNRGWGLATDDRKATRIAVQDGIVVYTTAELMRRWAEHTKATETAVTRALTNIQRYARFVPRANSAEAQWWLSHLQPGK